MESEGVEGRVGRREERREGGKEGGKEDGTREGERVGWRERTSPRQPSHGKQRPYKFSV